MRKGSLDFDDSMGEGALGYASVGALPDGLIDGNFCESAKVNKKNNAPRSKKCRSF